MIDLGVKYSATTAKPEPSGPGKVIHSYTDVTPHQGEDVHKRFIATQTEEEREAALADMPRATVTFYELPEGEPFFAEEPERPRDANGYALWDQVWIIEQGQLGSIEAAHGDEYELEIDDSDNLVRMHKGKFKPLADLTSDEDAALSRLADEEQAAMRAALASSQG